MQEQDNMPDSSSPSFQGPAHLVSDTDFSARGDEAKITSYMWYIHVTVRVNAADRLRDRVARLLDSSATRTAANPVSPPCSPPFDLDGIHIARSGNSSMPGHKGDVDGGAASELDDFTDYLVLEFFSRVMLETLVGTAPIEEHTDGYARVLAGIPAHFREAFCRRLYCLLFSKYILEWPHGIAAPEPAPGSIAAAAAAATTATTTDNAAVASNTGHEATTASTGSETTGDNGKRSSVRVSTGDDKKEDGFILDMDEILADDKRNDTFDGEDDKYPTSPGPASPGYQSTLGPSSPWPDTPSLGCSPELARAAYFGTVSDPQPMQYMRDWGRSSSSISGSIISSRDDGTARAAGACAGAGAGAGGSHDESLLSPRWDRRHQAPPHATPQGRRPASLVDPALRRDQQQVSHTGSCCPCRVREAWSHGVGPQR